MGGGINAEMSPKKRKSEWTGSKFATELTQKILTRCTIQSEVDLTMR